MRFLIDNALSPAVADGLRRLGYDADHVRDRGMAQAPDEQVFDLASAEDRIVVSADTDFGTILALRQAMRPSVILFRRDAPREPGRQLDALAANLPELAVALEEGSIAVIEGRRIRVRSLPING